MVATKPRAKRAKEDRSLDPDYIAIGMRDAYYHYPLLMKGHDIGVLACKFALTVFDVFYKGKEQEKQMDFLNVADNYKAGYKLGSQRCGNMDCKEHKMTLAKFNKLEAEEGDEGDLITFRLFKTETKIFIKLGHIKDIDDFNSKIRKGELYGN